MAKSASGAAERAASGPRGVLSRRPERVEDAAFLLDLFHETRGAMFSGLEAAMRDLLLRQQLGGQAMTYRLRYPDARFDIVEHEGVAIGRIVEDRAADAITIVDIALLARWRGRGIGTRLLGDILTAADGVRVRLGVDMRNASARRLYERLGFAIVARSDTDLTLEFPRGREP